MAEQFLNKPTLGQIDNILRALQSQAREGELPEFNFQSEEAYDKMANKTLKQIKFINALLINNKYIKLKQVLTEWGFNK
jgi:hypothetical protein